MTRPYIEVLADLLARMGPSTWKRSPGTKVKYERLTATVRFTPAPRRKHLPRSAVKGIRTDPTPFGRSIPHSKGSQAVHRARRARERTA